MIAPLPLYELLAKLVISLALLAFAAVTGAGAELVLGGILGYWLREGERAALRNVFHSSATIESAADPRRRSPERIVADRLVIPEAEHADADDRRERGT